MTARGTAFANIAYTILVVERSPRIEEVAASLGMTYATLHSRLINRTCFSADEIVALLRAVPDARLVDYLLSGTAFVAADRPKVDVGLSESLEGVQRGATRVVVEATDVLEIVDAALAGGGMDHRNISLVLDEITEAERALASLRMKISMPQG
jgi:hypothetical protein